MISGMKCLVCETGNYPDGQKIDALRAVFEKELDPSKCDMDSFEVPGRTICSARIRGNELFIQLDPSDAGASVIPQMEHKGPPPGDRGKPSGPPKLPARTRRSIWLDLICKKDLYAVDETVYHAEGTSIRSNAVREPVVDEFSQGEFKGLAYNLFVPEQRQGETYPLVVFLHDAGMCGDDPKIALAQGNGAVTWAKPEWQAEFPCYVLAPQIRGGVMLTKDDFTVDEEIETIKELIDHVIAAEAVDAGRVYATGQSMGCMAFSELNVRYPDFFAASLLVAGQWSPERMAEKCSRCNFWILVSQHDEKAFPGMNAVADAMEEAGTALGRYMWNAKSSQEEFARLVDAALQDDVTIRYTVFEGGTVVPEGKPDNGPENHMGTWPIVYEIGAIKRWLFSNKK